MVKRIKGDLCHDLLVAKTVGKLSFDENNNFTEWQGKTKDKFRELMGIDNIEKNACSLNIDIEEITERESFKQIRFTFESEIGAVVPCYLLVPHKVTGAVPLAITLQGHSTGFHNSIGVAKYENDAQRYDYPRNCFAIQAVNNGFAALCIEQRGMGETGSPRTFGEDVIFTPFRHTCAFTALNAINLGRTLIGERVWDVTKAIDAMEHFEDYGIDLEKIIITGNSGGGTTSYYAACFDERIKYSAPSCGFCSFEKSLMDVEHCACNYIPQICNWFEMSDLSALIAPRNLTVFAGKYDPVFPIDGVKDAFEVVKKIYKTANAEANCDLVEMPKDHYWCDDYIWPKIMEDTSRMGWW